MDSSCVPVVFETCETLVLLDGCSGVGPVDLSKRVIAMGWTQDESGTGEDVLTLVNLQKISDTGIKRKFTLTLTRDLGLTLSQIALQVFRFHMVCHRFCPQALAEALKVNTTVTNIDLADNKIGTEGAKAWCLAQGCVAPGIEMVK